MQLVFMIFFKQINNVYYLSIASLFTLLQTDEKYMPISMQESTCMLFVQCIIMCNFGWTGWCRILEPETNLLCVEFVGWYCRLIITSHMMCVMIYIDTNICCLTVPMIFPYWSKLTCTYYVHIITIRIFLVELVDIV